MVDRSKLDYTDTPSFVIPTEDGYKCYPVNAEAMEAFLEWKRIQETKDKDRSQAV